MRYPPIPWDKLEVGQKNTGLVKSVRDFGVFVDFGAETEGLVPISRISAQQIDDIYDHVEEGQQLDVRITRLREDGRIGLTAVEPAGMEVFASISPREWQKGVVSRITSF